jgi:deoxyribodipyrimidine photolyase-related protein
MRNLIIVLGDQLDRKSAAFDDFCSDEDVVWMAEPLKESEHVWCHKFRIVMFLSAMRHFRDELLSRNLTVQYSELPRDVHADLPETFHDLLLADLTEMQPQRVVVVQPGDYRVLQELKSACVKAGIELEVRPDRHFYCDLDDFAEYAEGRSSLRLEYFYRTLRKRHEILMQDDGEPVGGRWNYDHDNRESFPRQGPSVPTGPLEVKPDELTRAVIDLVEERFAKHPGRTSEFALPVTRRQALRFLKHFVRHLLPGFGRYEDAMWHEQPFLYHSRLSVLLNLKLLDPRECVDAAIAALEDDSAPINSVEGFVRQILGWREFVRGVYWLHMPDYIEKNFFEHERELPSFFWDGETEMRCVADSMSIVLRFAYAHHIHRLMVLGNFALLWGADPRLFHDWHMAMYADAVDWVSLPNTLGMSQFGDGGVVGTKPYISSGNYVNKMSNYCGDCKFNYRNRTGDDACPFTTLYWEFLDRNHDALLDNPRMKFPVKNLQKLRQEKPEELAEIRRRADQLRDQWG